MGARVGLFALFIAASSFCNGEVDLHVHSDGLLEFRLERLGIVVAGMPQMHEINLSIPTEEWRASVRHTCVQDFGLDEDCTVAIMEQISKDQANVAAHNVFLKQLLRENPTLHLREGGSDAEGCGELVRDGCEDAWVERRCPGACAPTARCLRAYSQQRIGRHRVDFVPHKSVMMDPASVLIVCSLLRRGMRVLEYGAGGSTLFFGQYVATWHSVEHNASFARAIAAHAANLPSVKVHIRERQCAGSSGASCDSEYPNTYEGRQLGWEAFETIADQLAPLDLVVVDGVSRRRCLHAIAREGILAPGAVVVVHDWERFGNGPYAHEKGLEELKSVYEIAVVDTLSPRQLAVLHPIPRSKLHK